MLSAMGTIKMAYTATTASSGTTTSIGNNDLTTSYQTIYTKAGSGAYSTNYYQIQARADNSTTLRFLITFGDHIQVEVILIVLMEHWKVLLVKTDLIAVLYQTVIV